MQDRTCLACEQVPVFGRFKYCSQRCKWTAANRARYKRPERACPGCGVDLSAQHGRIKYCAEACRRWVMNGHADLRTLPTACTGCGGSMKGKRANAKYCTQKCKLRASEQRRVRDDGARYLREREHRMDYALRYAKQNPHVGQAAKNRRKAQKREAGVFLVTGADWRRLCARHDHRCFYCRERKRLSMDHVIPLARGGRHSIGNLVPACMSCNASKSKRLIVEWKAKRLAA